jgi:hypothetical protein
MDNTPHLPRYLTDMQLKHPQHDLHMGTLQRGCWDTRLALRRAIVTVKDLDEAHREILNRDRSPSPKTPFFKGLTPGEAEVISRHLKGQLEQSGTQHLPLHPFLCGDERDQVRILLKRPVTWGELMAARKSIQDGNSKVLAKLFHGPGLAPVEPQTNDRRLLQEILLECLHPEDRAFYRVSHTTECADVQNETVVLRNVDARDTYNDLKGRVRGPYREFCVEVADAVYAAGMDHVALDRIQKDLQLVMAIVEKFTRHFKNDSLPAEALRSEILAKLGGADHEHPKLDTIIQDFSQTYQQAHTSDFTENFERKYLMASLATFPKKAMDEIGSILANYCYARDRNYNQFAQKAYRQAWRLHTRIRKWTESQRYDESLGLRVSKKLIKSFTETVDIHFRDPPLQSNPQLLFFMLQAISVVMQRQEVEVYLAQQRNGTTF